MRKIISSAFLMVAIPLTAYAVDPINQKLNNVALDTEKLTNDNIKFLPKNTKDLFNNLQGNLNNNINKVNADIIGKANELVNVTNGFQGQIDSKASKEYIDKNFPTKQAVGSLIDTEVAKKTANFPTKQEVGNLIQKEVKSKTQNLATKKEVSDNVSTLNTEISKKASKKDISDSVNTATTKLDQKITDAMKSVDTKIDSKVSKDEVTKDIANAIKDVDAKIDAKAGKEEVDTKIADAVKDVDTKIDAKASKEEVDTKIADAVKDVDTKIDAKASKEEVDNKIADAVKDIDTKIDAKASKEEVDNKIADAVKDLPTKETVSKEIDDKIAGIDIDGKVKTALSTGEVKAALETVIKAAIDTYDFTDKIKAVFNSEDIKNEIKSMVGTEIDAYDYTKIINNALDNSEIKAKIDGIVQAKINDSVQELLDQIKANKASIEKNQKEIEDLTHKQKDPYLYYQNDTEPLSISLVEAKKKRDQEGRAVRIILRKTNDLNLTNDTGPITIPENITLEGKNEQKGQDDAAIVINVDRMSSITNAMTFSLGASLKNVNMTIKSDNKYTTSKSFSALHFIEGRNNLQLPISLENVKINFLGHWPLTDYNKYETKFLFGYISTDLESGNIDLKHVSLNSDSTLVPSTRQYSSENITAWVIYHKKPDNIKTTFEDVNINFQLPNATSFAKRLMSSGYTTLTNTTINTYYGPPQDEYNKSYFDKGSYTMSCSGSKFTSSKLEKDFIIDDNCSYRNY